jgi:hypothetical protein
MKSFRGRAEKEVEWRARHRLAIMTVARFMGREPLWVGNELSKRILGGRKPVYDHTGEKLGYA